jgi:hypothetical protein
MIQQCYFRSPIGDIRPLCTNDIRVFEMWPSSLGKFMLSESKYNGERYFGPYKNVLTVILFQIERTEHVLIGMSLSDDYCTMY